MMHYEALEITKSATAADIRRAYRRLVLLTHPDRTPDPAAHARYLAINAAYEVLSDPARRHLYDNSLHHVAPYPIATTPGVNARDKYRRSTSTNRPRASKRPESYPHEATYLRYAPVGRTICKALLFFCLLLGIDRIWLLDYPHEEVLRCTLYSSKRGGSYCMVETPNATFRGACLNDGEVLSLRRTALFSQVISYQTVEKDEGKLPTKYDSKNFLYAGGGLLFLFSLFLTAAAGAWPGPTGRRQVDCAMTASLVAIVIVWLLTSF